MRLRIKGKQGGCVFDPQRHSEPLVLVSAGSGITPMMSILRYLSDRQLARDCVFLHGARTVADVIFADECARGAAGSPWLRYAVTLSQPSAAWTGRYGRLSAEFIVAEVPELAKSRVFLCGPKDFMDRLRESLLDAGVPSDRLHTEQFPHRAVS